MAEANETWYVPRFTKGDAERNYLRRDVDDSPIREKLIEWGFEIVGLSWDKQNFEVVPPEGWTKEWVEGKIGYMGYTEIRNPNDTPVLRSYCDEDDGYSPDAWTIYFVQVLDYMI